MFHNLPDGCTDDDPNAPWNEFPYKDCKLCGGVMLLNNDHLEPDYVCEDCGLTHEETNLCSCGHCDTKDLKMVIKIEKNVFGGERKIFKIICDCGVSGPWELKKTHALDSWNKLN